MPNLHERERINTEILRKEFGFTTWEGFAVTYNELELIQNLLTNHTLKNQFLNCIKQGNNISNDTGTIDANRLEQTQIIGTRIDGLSFFLQGFLCGHIPADKQKQRIRTMTQSEGILFSLLAKPHTKEKQITYFSPFDLQEKTSQLQTALTYDANTPIFDAIYPLLSDDIRSQENVMNQLSIYLRKKSFLHPSYQELFQYKGDQLEEYLQRMKNERGGFRWGINNDSIENQDYSFQTGHISQKEFSVQNSQGTILSADISFIITKPNTLEHRIIQLCEETIHQSKE